MLLGGQVLEHLMVEHDGERDLPGRRRELLELDVDRRRLRLGQSRRNGRPLELLVLGRPLFVGVAALLLPAVSAIPR